MQLKYLLFLFVPFVLFSCSEENNDQKEQQRITSTINNLDWLLGSWVRTNNEEGKKTFESWTKKSPEEYIGLGYTLQGQDTVFKENMRILKKEARWIFEVSVTNDEAPTIFTFSKKAKERFICENPKNEFPKKIEYYLKDKKLEAKISGGDMEVLFLFDKKNDN